MCFWFLINIVLCNLVYLELSLLWMESACNDDDTYSYNLILILGLKPIYT